MKKCIKLISLTLISLGCEFVYSMNLIPTSISLREITATLPQLQNLIESIPISQRESLLTRYTNLPQGGPARLSQFRALLTDAQNAYRAMPPPVAEAIVPPAAVAEEIVPPVAEPIVVRPHLQVEQVDPQVHVQPVVQQPDPAVARLILQQPAPLIEGYFRRHNLFGPGKLIVDVKSFNLRYVNDLYRHLECEHLNPMIATKFLQFCFGKYIDLRAVQLYISELSIGEICNIGGNRNALTFAFLDGLVQFLEDDSIILPKIKKSDLVDNDGIPLYDTYIQQNGGNLRQVDEAILAYNSFVDSLNQHVIASITSAEIEGGYDFDASQASIRYYRDDMMIIDEKNSFDEILLERMDDPSLEMNVVCYNFNNKLADLYIEKNVYDTLSDDDKKIAKKIAYACYLRRYALLTGPLDNDISNSFRDSYLRTAKLSIEEGSLYHKVVDLTTLAGLRINSDPALYSVEPLRAVIRAINLNIATMSEAAFKEYFQKLIFRMIHLSMSPKVGNTLTSKKPRIFGSPISTQDLQQYEIENWLKEYHRNKTAHTGSFGATAFADTDYYEGDPNEHTLLQHLRDALMNIYGDGFGNAGMYYSSEIIRFIAAKLEKSILFLETHPELTPKATSTLDDLSITLGMFLQGLHHCPNGRVELISKTFPRLMEASDIRTLNIAQISHIILKLAASDLIADTLQFHIMNGRQRTRLATENATFFAATLRLLGGKFGAIVGGGFLYEWNDATNLLKNYLEHARPAIWDALPRETQSLITANRPLTEEIVTDILKTAISPSRLIEYLIDEKNVGTTDLLIQKYLDSQRIMGYSFNSAARRKQIIADILRSIDAI